MTVDMLAAAFIWPEDVLAGRTQIGDDLEPDDSDGLPLEVETRGAPGTAPFWTALMRRLRADSPAVHTELR